MPKLHTTVVEWENYLKMHLLVLPREIPVYTFLKTLIGEEIIYPACSSYLLSSTPSHPSVSGFGTNTLADVRTIWHTSVTTPAAKTPD